MCEHGTSKCRLQTVLALECLTHLQYHIYIIYIYMIKRNWPRVDPWRTPQAMLLVPLHWFF